MTIVKPGNIQLSMDNLLSNVEIDLTQQVINISYCPVNDDPPPYDPIGFVTIKQEDGGMEYLTEWIDYLNNQNFSALIWIENKEKSKPNLPIHINPYLCCSYEGQFKFLENKVAKTTMEKVLKSVDKLLDTSHFCGSVAVSKLLEKAVDFKDTMVFMYNTGRFHFIRDNNFYTVNNIRYGYYNQWFPPLNPIKLTSSTPPPAFSWEDYEGYY